MNARPQVSVITATYNDGKFISDAIESILAQSWSDFEFIIVNDGSTDDTLEILSRYANLDSRISLIINPKRLGRGASRNRALIEASGEWVFIFDGDDISYSDRISHQMYFLQQSPDIDYLGSNCHIIDKASSKAARHLKIDLAQRHFQILWQLCFNYPFHHTTTVGRREVFLSCGGYPTHIPVCEDIYLWMKMALKGVKFANLDIDLVTYRANSSPNHYSLNQSIAEQLHRNFVERLLGQNVSQQVYALIWHTNSKMNDFPYNVESSTIFKAINQLIELFDHLNKTVDSPRDQIFVEADLIRRLTSIKEIVPEQLGLHRRMYNYY